MILAVIYFLVFCYLLNKLSFFKDSVLSFRFLLFVVAVKILACSAYYWVYFMYYPVGQNGGDSVSTMHDAKIIYDALPNHPQDFFRMMFGFHSESESDPLYKAYFQYTEKWDRADITSDFFLNDNRTPIRLNALVMLFSFGSYAVHALVMLVLSFIGQFAFYKTFKRFFAGKEVVLAFIIFFSPSVLFWSSGVLKEPIALFLMGLTLHTFFKLFIDKCFTFKYCFLFIGSCALFLILKPYILVLLLFPLVIYTIVKQLQIKQVFITYLLSLSLVLVLGIVVLKTVFHKDVINTIVTRENDFVNLSRGGIFFLNDKNYLRLEYKDSLQYEKVDTINDLFRIKPHAQLMYWELKNIKDTIYISDNQDTTLYKLLRVNSPAGSAITMRRLENSFSSFAVFIPLAIFNVLCKPLFYDSRSMLEHLASLENLLFIIFFVMCLWYRHAKSIDRNMLWLCVCIVLCSSVLVGITTTVMGAIVRYKVPFIPFLLMIPLLYLDAEKLKQIPVLKWFFTDKS